MITPKDQQLFPDPGFFRGIHLKKTIKDKCRIFGETTMYYGNAGSVQVLSPIPGSPSPDTVLEIDNTRADCPKRASRVRFDLKGETKKNMARQKIPSKKATKGTNYSLPPIKHLPAAVLSKKMTGGNSKSVASTGECKPINLPSFRTSQDRKRLPRGNNSSTHDGLRGQRTPTLAIVLPSGPRSVSLPSLRIQALVAR